MKSKIVIFCAVIINYLLPNFVIRKKTFLDNKMCLLIWGPFVFRTEDLFVFKITAYLDFHNGLVIFLMIPYLSCRFGINWPFGIGKYLYNATTYRTDFELADNIEKDELIKRVTEAAKDQFPNAKVIVHDHTEKEGNDGC